VDGQKPVLAAVLEDVAQIMNLGDGHQRLELDFEDGHLRRWRTAAGPEGTTKLAEFDDRASWLTGRIPGADVAPAS
jgi:hypothetical protein